MKAPQFITIVLLLTAGCSALKPSYYPPGPQVDVPPSDLVGWIKCWATYYADQDTQNITQVYENCAGDYLLYGCRETTKNANFTVLAAGERSAVMTDTGRGETNVTTNNFVDWYFSTDYSIGFAAAGDTISRESCDVLDGDSPHLKLCWHTDGIVAGTFNWGYRCGANQELGNEAWSREIWRPQASPCEGLNEGDPCVKDQCTLNSTCQAGECVGTPVTCQECQLCDPVGGCVAKENGTKCSDDSLCTENDACQTGICVGEAITCTVPQGCFNSTCSAVTGQCVDECPPVAAPKAKTSSADRFVAPYMSIIAILYLLQ